jgi:H+/Cl- antiporter ClcA
MSANVLDAEQPLLPDNGSINYADGRIKKSRDRLCAYFERPGTVPLAVAALVIGCSCGIVAFVYDSMLNAILRWTWSSIPEAILSWWKRAEEGSSWWREHTWVLGLYIVLVATLFGVVVGASQRFLGCPGDLPETIESFHSEGFVPYQQARLCTMSADARSSPSACSMSRSTLLSDCQPSRLEVMPVHVMLKHSCKTCLMCDGHGMHRLQAPSMFVCSLFSVCAGCSLGPEAPLLCLCASTVSLIFKKLVPVNDKMLCYCSLMGMAAGLAAFFGVTMGGAPPAAALCMQLYRLQHTMAAAGFRRALAASSEITAAVTSRRKQQPCVL